MNGVADGFRTHALNRRRLRPFWGQRPSQMIITGAFRAVLYGVIAGVLVRIVIDPGIVGAGDTAESLTWAFVTVAALLAVGTLYNLVRLVLGILALTGGHTHEGVVRELRTRYRGDFLPRPVDQVLELRRRHRSPRRGPRPGPRRRTRVEILIEDDRGITSYVIRPRFHDPSLQGRRVRLTVARPTGYVRRIDPVGAAPAAADSPIREPARGDGET